MSKQLTANRLPLKRTVTAIDKLEKAKRRIARADAQGDHSGRVATAGTKNLPTHCRAGDRSPSRKSLERVMLGQAEIRAPDTVLVWSASNLAKMKSLEHVKLRLRPPTPSLDGNPQYKPIRGL
jgi:hypothetical protein